jgi:hypothetical protein
MFSGRLALGLGDGSIRVYDITELCERAFPLEVECGLTPRKGTVPLTQQMPLSAFTVT